MIYKRELVVSYVPFEVTITRLSISEYGQIIFKEPSIWFRNVKIYNVSTFYIHKASIYSTLQTIFSLAKAFNPGRNNVCVWEYPYPHIQSFAAAYGTALEIFTVNSIFQCVRCGAMHIGRYYSHTMNITAWCILSFLECFHHCRKYN